MAIKILVADDSPTIQKVIQITLDTADFELETALDESVLMTKLKSENFDLILLDFTLSAKKNGYQLAKEIKTLKANIKIIILFGTFDDFPKEKLKSFGIDGYIIKPFESGVLTDLCQNIIRNDELLHVNQLESSELSSWNIQDSELVNNESDVLPEKLPEMETEMVTETSPKINNENLQQEKESQDNLNFMNFEIIEDDSIDDTQDSTSDALDATQNFDFEQMKNDSLNINNAIQEETDFNVEDYVDDFASINVDDSGQIISNENYDLNQKNVLESSFPPKIDNSSETGLGEVPPILNEDISNLDLQDKQDDLSVTNTNTNTNNNVVLPSEDDLEYPTLDSNITSEDLEFNIGDMNDVSDDKNKDIENLNKIDDSLNPQEFWSVDDVSSEVIGDQLKQNNQIDITNTPSVANALKNTEQEQVTIDYDRIIQNIFEKIQPVLDQKIKDYCQTQIDQLANDFIPKTLSNAVDQELKRLTEQL